MTVNDFKKLKLESIKLSEKDIITLLKEWIKTADMSSVEKAAFLLDIELRERDLAEVPDRNLGKL